MRYLLLLLFFITPLQAQEVPAYRFKTLYGCRQNNCQEFHGSCVLLKIEKGHGWFLGVGHTIRGTPYVKLYNHWYKASVIQQWKTPVFENETVALIRTTEPVPSSDGKGYSRSRISNRKPKVGDKVWLMGYPSTKYDDIRTVITDIQGSTIFTRHHLKQGASGGAVIYQDDETLAGLIHAYDPQNGEQLITSSSLIWAMLENQFSRLLPAEKHKESPPERSPVESEPKPDPDGESVSKKDLESMIKEWEINRDKKLKESIDLIIAQNKDEQKNRDETLGRISEENEGHYVELKEFLAILSKDLNNATDQQNEKIDKIKKDNKTFQEEFWEKIENPNGLSGDGGTETVPEDYSDVPITPEIPGVPDNLNVPDEQGSLGLEQKGVANSSGDRGLFESIGLSLLNIPWLSILGGLGVAIPGGAAGYLGLRTLSVLLQKRRRYRLSGLKDDATEGVKSNDEGGEAVMPTGLFPRDLSEAKQIIGLRQYEQREPILDSLRGILFENELVNNPDQSLQDAFNAINNNLNNIAPISTRHETVEDKNKTKTEQ